MAARGHPTFGCFGQLVKIGDDVVRAWSRILHTLPDARLLLKAHELGREGVRDATAARFARHGIDADRLILEGGSPRAEYFGAYHRIDVALARSRTGRHDHRGSAVDGRAGARHEGRALCHAHLRKRAARGGHGRMGR